MTAEVYTKQEVDKLLQAITDRLDKMGNTPAPDPDPMIAFAKTGDTAVLVSFLERELVLTKRIRKGSVLRLTNGRAVNVLSEGSTVTIDQPVGSNVAAGDRVTVVRVPGEAAVEQPKPEPEPVPTPTPDPLPQPGELILGEFCGNIGQAGGGDQVLPGKAGTNYFWASEAQIAKWAKKGMRKGRVGIAWERIQPIVNGPLRMEYVAELLDNMELFGKYGVRVLVDIHNYGGHSITGNERDRMKIGSAKVPYGALADVCGKVVQAINNRPNARSAFYGLDIMNEPVGLPGGIDGWVREAQSCIDSIRKVDRKCAIAVNSYDWGTTARFKKMGNEKLFTLVDPSKNTEIHTHIYMDVEGGGKYLNDSISVTAGINAATEAVILCQRAGFKHCFGEVGAPGYMPNALAALRAFLPWARDQGSDCYAWWITETAKDNIMSLEADRNAPAVKAFTDTFSK